MGINEKKIDILVSIDGDCASQYQHDVSLLLRGELPPDWRSIPCSKDAFVAKNLKTNAFYKEFLPRNRFERIKQILRGSRCQRAQEQASILRGAKLPTPRILCWGKGKNNVFLISEGFNGIGFFQSLIKNFRSPLTIEEIRKKRILLKEAGSLIGKMHARGIVHGDLRQNNLLVKKDETGFHFSLIDNERNRKWRFIPRSQILKNLIQFSICTDNILTKTDLMRLYKAYTIFYPRFSGRDKRRYFLQQVFRKSQKRILAIQLKKILRETSLFYTNKNFQGEYLLDSIVARQFANGQDPAQWFSTGKIELKNDKNISVRLLSGLHGNVVAKRFAVTHLVFHPGCWLKIHRAQRQWEMSHVFMALGVPVARPLGFATQGKGIFISSTYYFSEHLENAKDLVRQSRGIENFHDWLKKYKIISRLALYLARLHNSGYCHGDTKWANILANANSGKFWFIDLDGACRVKFNLGRDVCKDLSRFAVDMTKYNVPKHFQDEFLDVYCSARILNKKRVQKKIAPILSRIHARHEKKMTKQS